MRSLRAAVPRCGATGGLDQLSRQRPRRGRSDALAWFEQLLQAKALTMPTAKSGCTPSRVLGYVFKP
jgi:hypothetical protein